MSSFSTPRHQRPSDAVIAVMGSTGSGKSKFIQSVTGDRSIRIGHGVNSQTSDIYLSHCFNDDGRCITLVDTPSFDHSQENITDVLVLQRIVSFLETCYEPQREKSTLNGIIYLHRISDPRMGGVSARNLNMFKQLCGTKSLRNVLIVTTRWDEIDEMNGIARQGELETREQYFKQFTDAGARFCRHDGTPESCRRILGKLVNNHPIPLLVQRELANKKRLSETTAGSKLVREMDLYFKEYDKEMDNLDTEIRNAASNKDENRRQDLERELERVTKESDKLYEDQTKLDGVFHSARNVAAARKTRAAEEVRIRRDTLISTLNMPPPSQGNGSGPRR